MPGRHRKRPCRNSGEIPPHVEYSLTELGRALTPALDTLGRWGHKVWRANGSHAKIRIIDHIFHGLIKY